MLEKGENANGRWKMAVINFDRGRGTLNNVKIQVCYLTIVAPSNFCVTSMNSSGPISLQNAIIGAISSDGMSRFAGTNTMIESPGIGLTTGTKLKH